MPFKTGNMNLLCVLLLSSVFSLLGSSDDKITWISPTSFDFGEIRHGEVVVHNFTFKNTSGEPLKIDNVRTSCGCTTPDWSNAPILPDSLGQIIIEYDGRHHASRWLADSKRREALEDEGWLYIQVTAENLRDEDSQKELAERVAQRMSLRLGSLCGYVGE